MIRREKLLERLEILASAPGPELGTEEKSESESECESESPKHH